MSSPDVMSFPRRLPLIFARHPTPGPPARRRARGRSREGMRAAKFQGEGRVEILEAPEPQAGAGEVVVRVAACALCGSDLRPWRRGWPVTSGHEIAGRVDQPGHPRHGERVLVYIPVFC